jgi:hypothetical protein
VNYIPADTRTGYVQSWHLTIQRELARNLLFDVAYVGNKSTKLVILGDLNQARPNGPTENLSLQARRPLASYQFIQSAFPGGTGTYHGLQTKLERRFTSGLYALNSFTWSKAIDTPRDTSRPTTATTAGSTTGMSWPRRDPPATTRPSTTRPAWCGTCLSERGGGLAAACTRCSTACSAAGASPASTR